MIALKEEVAALRGEAAGTGEKIAHLPERSHQKPDANTKVDEKAAPPAPQRENVLTRSLRGTTVDFFSPISSPPQGANEPSLAVGTQSVSPAASLGSGGT